MKELSNEALSTLHKLVSDSGRIGISTHMRPDGDAMGSSIALLSYLTGIGKEADIILDDKYPETLEFMTDEEDRKHIVAYGETPEEALDRISGCGLIFCLDYNSFPRAGRISEAIEKAPCGKILIDHHLNPRTEDFRLAFSETEVSSTSELLYRILLRMPETGGSASRLPAKAAAALMTGMTTDTNNFANSVFPGTLEMASGLLAAGVDRDRILSNLYCKYRENRFRLLGELLSCKMTVKDNGVAYMIIDSGTAARFDIREGETEGFVNIPLGMENVRMSILVKEDEDKYRVSVRSKAGTSANLFASAYFSGGGHELAAGGRIDKTDGRPLDYGSLCRYISESAEKFFKK